MKKDDVPDIRECVLKEQTLSFTDDVYGRFVCLVDGGLEAESSLSNMLEFNFSTVADASQALGLDNGWSVPVGQSEFASGMVTGHDASDFSLGLQGLSVDFMYAAGLENDLEAVFAHMGPSSKSYTISSETVIELAHDHYADSGFEASSGDLLELRLLTSS